MRLQTIPVCLCLTVLVTFATAAKPTAAELEFFEKQVRPVLANHCYQCHSTQAKRLEASLYLDSRAGFLKGGDSGAAIVPGKPDKSLLVEAINYESYEMPPKGKLPAKKIAVLTKWIEMGAPWPDEKAPTPLPEKVFDWKKRKAEHWSWQPIRPVTPPAVKNRGWPKNPIDQFILAKLEANGLPPAGAADRRTLIRRIYFDLIGLPPTPEEVQAFVDDASPDAYEQVVDRLLASKHFGEKWGRHWLDLVRYAESHGHEFDYPIEHAWRYRDYVIRAFNADVPYDQLVREHIAGDLLPHPRRHPTEGYNESILGTGFWFFGEATHAPTDVKADEADRIDNQIDVFSKTFLGLTVACARCHDHKFDPIPTADYYAMAGFMQSSRRQLAMLDPQGKIAQTAAALREHRKQGTAIVQQVVEQSQGDAKLFARHLLAAHEAVRNPGRETSEQPDIVFEDFESGNYEGWTISGDAFGPKPATGTLPNQQPVSGFAGKGLVNTYYKGDGTTGTATSKKFTIERDYINLLVGGGHHANKTCVNLLVDGNIVKSAVGKGPTDREALSARSWDVRPWHGKQAQIQIVDNERGGWGHINVDHIVFSAAPDAKQSGPSYPSREAVARIAEKHELEAERLLRWVQALSTVKDESHPLYAWATLAKTDDDAKFAAEKKRLAARVLQQQERAQAAEKETVLLADFSPPKGDAADPWNGWFATGEAFGDSPTRGDEWDSTSRGLRLTEPGLAHSGLVSKKLQGVLRSPTFELTHRNILIRMQAENVTVRLIIDGYQMEVFSGLLFGGTRLKNVNTGGKFAWQRLGNEMYLGHKAYLEFIDHGDGYVAIDEIRLSQGGAPPESPDATAATVVAGDAVNSLESLAGQYGTRWQAARKRFAAGQATRSDIELINWAISHNLLPSPAAEGASPRLAKLSVQMSELERKLPAPEHAIAITDGTGENEHVFIRGSHKNLGDVAPRRFLIAIAGEDQPQITAGSGRLALAQRVLAEENPFPARVLVNRLWHHLFGRGIVPTVDDFGKMGQPPSHPELLDWLAADFRQEGWSIKRALRQMVLSSTYRMSSNPDEVPPRANEIDPDNTLLYRMPIRRMTAEQIRDAVLAVSGQLKEDVYGPSVNVHLTPFMQGRGRPKSGPLDGNGRRSLYLAIRRNFLSPMMLTFDFPVPFSSMGRRTVSNVPAQALILMNDPFVTSQAKAWAQRALQEKETAGERMDWLFESAFAQPPTDAQRQRMQTFLAQQAEAYNASEEDVRVWTDLCHTLLNMKEFIFLR